MSSDILTSNVQVFIFFIGNIAFILLLNSLTSLLSKKNYLRTIVSDTRWEMFYGQVINLIGPLVLPWTFMMLETGFRNFRNKLTVAVTVLVFFMGVIFPFIYFCELLN